MVTKSFRGRTARARLLDARRARREFELLGALLAAGVSVPAPLGLEHGADGVWHVHLEALANTRTADVALTVRAGREALLGELARLLASQHVAGLDQPDLHAKNTLVDASGRAFAIDFHGARLVAGPRPRLFERDLVRLAASHRELLPTRARQRFFVAWWRALPAEVTAQLPERTALAARVEAEARLARRTTAAAYANSSSRYFRVGGSFRAVDAESGARWLARRDAPAATVAAALSGAGGSGLARVTGTRRAIEAAWGAVAQLAAHGLDGPRPLLLDRRSEEAACAWFDHALDRRPLAPEERLDEPALPPTPAQRAALDAALAFRGLGLASEVPATFLCAGGTWIFSHRARLVPAQAARAASARAERKLRRRARRERAGRLWPTLCAPALLPVTRAALSAAAAAARFTPLEARLRRNLALGLPERAPRPLTAHVRRHMARLALEWGQLAYGRDMLFERVVPEEIHPRTGQAHDLDVGQEPDALAAREAP